MNHTSSTAPRRLDARAGAEIADGLEEYREQARAAYQAVADITPRKTSSAQELAAALYDYQRAELALARARA